MLLQYESTPYWIILYCMYHVQYVCAVHTRYCVLPQYSIIIYRTVQGRQVQNLYGTDGWGSLVRGLDYSRYPSPGLNPVEKAKLEYSQLR